MKKIISSLCFLTLQSFQLWATSPMDLELSESQLTRVQCEIKSNKDLKGYPEKGLPKLGTYHYDLHLPTGYHENPDESYPLIIIASPGGKAKMGKMADYIKKNRWMAAMLVESSNKGSWPVMAGNEVAAFNDLVKRVRCKPGFIFSTGMSGGSRAATQLASMREGLGGVILQAAAFWYVPGSYYQHQYKELNQNAYWYGLFGNKDYNMQELKVIFDNLPDPQLKLEVYEGGHSWAPPEPIKRAFDWQIQKTLLESKYKSSNKGIYLWYSNLLQDKISKSEDNFEKHELMDQLSDFVKRFKVKPDDQLKEDLSLYKIALKEGSKTYRDELSAKKLYKTTEAYEVKTQAKLKGTSDDKATLVALEKKYLDIMKKYSDTTYAEKSKLRAQALNLQHNYKPKQKKKKK